MATCRGFNWSLLDLVSFSAEHFIKLYDWKIYLYLLSLNSIQATERSDYKQIIIESLNFFQKVIRLTIILWAGEY